MRGRRVVDRGGGEPDEDETGVGDRRVRQCPLQVGLHDRGDGADDERQDGQRHDDRAPVGAVDRERHQEDPQERREPGDLGGRRHERGDRAGCALVDVGRPHVERHRRDLEPEADDQQRDAGEQRAVLVERVPGEEARDPGEGGGAGRAVHQRHAVEEDRRREGAEHEVLDAGFLRREAAAVECHQHVERDRQRLERHEHDDQVVGRGHDDHRRGRQRQHREVFGDLEARGPDVADGEQQGQEQRGDDEDAEEHRERVDVHHRRQGDDGAVVAEMAPLPGQHRAGRDGAGERDDDRDRLDRRARAQHRAQQHDQHAGAREREDGRDAQPVDAGRDDRIGTDDGEERAHHFSAFVVGAFGTDFASGPSLATPGSR